MSELVSKVKNTDIEEARKVLWLKSNPRPLEELAGEGYLTRDRLEWATRWAYNAPSS